MGVEEEEEEKVACPASYLTYFNSCYFILDDGASDYYSRENTTEMWDSSGKTSTGNDFDLADFAAAALKFRAEMQSMELGKLENNRADEEEDAMRKLLEEQMENEIPGVVEEDEELPDWADENDIDGLSTIAQLNPTVSVEEPIIETLAPLSTNKTSLLLEVRAVYKVDNSSFDMHYTLDAEHAGRRIHSNNC